MSLCKERAFEVLEKISFERIAGTKKELECVNILKVECDKAGVDSYIQDFEIDDPEIIEASLEVVSPVPYKIHCIGIGNSGITPDEGIIAPLCYVETGLDANITDVKGKIVLMTGMVKPEQLKKIKKAGAVAGISVDGSFFDPSEMVSELRTRNIRNKEEDDNFPTVLIHINDAEKLLRARPESLKLVLKQNMDKKSISHNVVATIKGTKKPDEEIIFSAHLDSVIYSSGAWDNATGSITIMELMHYFNENKPERTVRFVWCGSEEIGLKGSKAYVDSRKEDIDKILFNINVDMTGVLLGFDIAVCTCEEATSKYIDYLGKIEGFPIATRVDIYSSDSTSFAIAGIPAVTFARVAPRGGAEIHSRRDVLDHLDKDAFINTVKFMASFSEKVINAKVFPVLREIPKNLCEKLEDMKKRMGNTKKEELKEKKEEK